MSNKLAKAVVPARTRIVGAVACVNVASWRETDIISPGHNFPGHYPPGQKPPGQIPPP